MAVYANTSHYGFENREKVVLISSLSLQAVDFLWRTECLLDAYSTVHPFRWLSSAAPPEACCNLSLSPTRPPIDSSYGTRDVPS